MAANKNPGYVYPDTVCFSQFMNWGLPSETIPDSVTGLSISAATHHGKYISCHIPSPFTVLFSKLLQNRIPNAREKYIVFRKNFQLFMKIYSIIFIIFHPLRIDPDSDIMIMTGRKGE